MRATLSIFSAGLFLSLTAWGQNSCDLTLDGKVDTADVQAIINMSLGVAPCSASIAGSNVCNIIVVQRVINASLGAPCVTSTGIHSVALSWTASNSGSVTGYKIYRSTATGGPYTLLSSVGNVTSFTDNTAVSGVTYFYVITSTNGTTESSYSAQALAAVPTP
jgi:hypothetical protein